ncbi:bifunctional phosphoribosylaminoimidazolecarboxamide formyltransferase/IMP cyclohydrolase [Patescibacteria group bacterium]|nr:bifunctional phosphoribosylaminoimidazolecarboxamide formyltransferase/IMP cyclohydrolase [Patescibacteria group bacterium]MBU1124103.1 bifunctional phosphoribosylaminoimidazolecarboxamide formyltransferase/IMP cyclohydrolase [Patescibacteria group bacterium]MBU1911538.1 bifunctional phosphoribosylaminoimidazolecarboxamide formyltransferase/IMP cyclohydrolase [Patescibacteria group bacterium]
MKKRALISVSDKTNLTTFAASLVDLDYEIISTGGTEKALKEANIAVTPVEEITKFPECFGGRLKTLHPLIFGGLLFRRGNSEDEAQAKELGIESIDLVVVNLYPFEETARKEGVSQEELVEQIDIGGPSLLRAAAKNADHVTVICDIGDYDRVVYELKDNGETSTELRGELARKVFLRTAAYDTAITQTLSGGTHTGVLLTNKTVLRYGENPHQWGTYYDIYGSDKPRWKLHQGKEMSYLNILDADGALNLVCEFERPSCACIKHASPCGVAVNDDIAEAFQRSYDADRLSAFGVIVALNRPCTKNIIDKIIEQKIFTEVIIAPGYEDGVLEFLAEKRPNIRAIEHQCPDEDAVTFRSSLGGMLVQNQDTKIVTKDDLTVATETKPTDEQIEDLLFAWKVVKHAKSNAIVFAKDLVSVGIGCGQTSRVDSTIIAARRAGERAKGAVMASDAFFPFPDSVEEAAKNGIAAIIQPGGSIRDEEVITKANELGIGMVMTGVRGFRH